MYFSKSLGLRSIVLLATLLTSEVTSQDSRIAASGLTISATAVPAIYLEINPRGTDAPITSTNEGKAAGTYTLDFGTVSDSGSVLSEDVSIDSSQPEGTLYTATITLIPRFSGFRSTTAHIKVTQALSNPSVEFLELREGETPATTSSVETAASKIITTTALNRTPITRRVGFLIKHSATRKPESVSLRATLIYELTVP